ncbi:RluA family pseudouridine synthase [Corallococcus sp. AB049A]|uniref:Pseudouridine synthase n=1 Tax=Corallococcus interemptor TaxID=2316720 RepID=A0A3A8PQD6_9BACT|nr:MULTISPECIES: RluA family pseudouridine synthase [Corallococcus]RKH58656.1 RluA family pseudouridine synthase [Corallococcus interemptor]RKI52925.1 RluA family pseudouridine synthase [Corallococcus sp. AB049A]
MKRRTFKAEGAHAGRALVDAVAAELALPVADVRRLVDVGAVYVAGKRARDGAVKLLPSQVVTVVLEEAGQSPLEAPKPAAPMRVLFEDADVLAVDKPAGLNAQPTEGRVGGSLVDLVGEHLGRQAGLVHRLDRETSGVTVFGKTAAATSALAEAFREGTARKRYLAATGPGLEAGGTVDLPLSKDPSRPGRWRATRAANGVPAWTDYRTLFAGEAFSLVELLPRTGRTHQLRAHLTALGHPILGDARYGGAGSAGSLVAPRCLLHAHALELGHPRTGRPLRLEAPVPDDLRAFFEAAGVRVPEGPIVAVEGS